MSWRVQYRDHRTTLKTPIAGEIHVEDGHSRDTAITRAVEILNKAALKAVVTVQEELPAEDPW